MMMFHPDQDDTKCKHNCMTCRACVKLPLDVDGIDDSIGTQMMKPPNYLLVYLADLDYGKNPDTGTFKKERGCIFS